MGKAVSRAVAWAASVVGAVWLWAPPAGAQATQTTGGDKPPPGLEATVAGVTASVRQYETAVAHVTARNASASAVTVTRVTALPVTGLDICLRGSSPCTRAMEMTVSLAPGDARVFTWTIEVPDQVTAGKHPLVFEVSYAGPTGVRRATAASSIEAAHVGQTGGLDVLKVSFLFLPGILVVAVFYLLTATGTQPEWVKRLTPANPEAWAVGVLLSFAAIPLYAWRTGRSYLAGYALADLKWVWLGSVAAGVLLFLLYLLGRLMVRTALSKYAADRTPTPSDTPGAALAKLTRWRPIRGGVAPHRSAWFPQVRVKQGSEVVQVFKLADDTAGSGHWVAPPIQLAREELGDRWGTIEQAVTGGSGRDVVKALERCGATAAVTWAPAGMLTGPELVPPAALVKDVRLRPS